ncbi:MAG: histidine utilization repressor [Burkholderiales bacterium]|nr:histidine utilization repressor [Burkholderiales bacterium]
MGKAPPRHAAAPYARVKQHVKAQLARGRWRPGALMPSEAELVAKFGVSRMTVNRALRELQGEGLVDRIQGVGTFAARRTRLSSMLTIRDLHEEIEARGHRHRVRVALKRQERALPWLARQLGLETGAAVFHTRIVHLDNDAPLQCEDRYVNPGVAPDYLKVDFTRTTPTHYLLEIAPLWEGTYTIEAAVPTAAEARLLGIERSEPCLVIARRTVCQGVPVTFARLVHPGSRYQLEGVFEA